MLINNKKDILANLRTLNREYQKAKHSFIKASEFKGAKPERKKKWEDAKGEYEHYLREIYGKDIDALGELGEIYSHLAQLSDTEKKKDEYYKKAIRQFQKSLDHQKQNPFHQIRIAENLVKLKKDKRALETYQGLLDSDPENLTCLINAGILAVRAQDKNVLREIIESMEKYHPENKVLSQLRDSLDRLRKGKKGMEFWTNQPIITKGTAKNLQWLSQWNGVLLLLLANGGATKSQIKEKWLDNTSTTESIVRTMLDVGRDGINWEGESVPMGEPIVEETTLLGTKAKGLTKKGKEEAERVKKWVEKADSNPDIELDPKFGPGITAKLVKRYKEWIC